MPSRGITPHALRWAAKHAIWKLAHRHVPSGRPDILIFTTGRSGGTWLTETLSAEPGLAFVGQPFSLGLADPFLRRRGVFPQEVIENGGIPIRPRDEEFLRDFFEKIFRGELRVSQPWNPFDTSFHARTDRIVAKVHSVKAWIEWFGEQFPNTRVVYHVRHPISLVLSGIRAGWNYGGRRYLADPWFLEHYLGDGRHRFAIDRIERGSPLERGLVAWSVQNFVPLSVRARHPEWLITSYEELVVSPAEILSQMVERLELSDRTSIEKRVAQPSATVFDERTAAILRSQSEQSEKNRFLLGRWRNEISPDDLASCLRILESFEIDAYSDSIAPHSSLLGYEGSAERLRRLEPDE